MLYTELILLFLTGYLAIIFERFLHVNKAAVALVLGVLCWMLYFAYQDGNVSFTAVGEHISDVAQIIFFLFAAMVIVELVDSHQGFKMITNLFTTSSKRKLLWLLIPLSFFLSATLDNLTAMIVMVSLLRKLIPSQKERWLFGSILVIAVNAGGAWTPIGDVTTTMLWINEKITTWQTMRALFLPSVLCALTAGGIATFYIKEGSVQEDKKQALPLQPGGRSVLFMGVGSLIMVPIWKALFGLPPFMGALLGLGILWLITDITHFRHGEARWHLRVTHVLTKVDTSGVMFFLGILLAVDALAASGLLKDLAEGLHTFVPNQNWVAMIIGLVSSVIDNVPLVAATMGMYDINTYPQDSALWQMIAYAAGTGGSILVIGSAAGVAFMGLEKVDFLWYFRKISWIALVSFFVGFATYLLTKAINFSG